MSAHYLAWFKKNSGQISSSEKGMAALGMIVLLLAGVIVTTFLVQQRTSFMPKAQDGGDGVSGAGSDNSSYDSGISDSGSSSSGDDSGNSGNDSSSSFSDSGSSDSNGGSSDGQSFSDQSQQTQQDFTDAYGDRAAEAWSNEHSAQLSFESAVASMGDNVSLESLSSIAQDYAEQTGAGIHAAAGWVVEAAIAHGATAEQAGGLAAQTISLGGGSGWDAMTGAADGAGRAAEAKGMDPEKTSLDAATAAGNAAGLSPNEVSSNLSNVASARGYEPPASNPAVTNPATAPAEVTAEGAAQPAPGPLPAPIFAPAPMVDLGHPAAPQSQVPVSHFEGFKAAETKLDGSPFANGSPTVNPENNWTESVRDGVFHSEKTGTSYSWSISTGQSPDQKDSQITVQVSATNQYGTTSSPVTVHNGINDPSGNFESVEQVQQFLGDNGQNLPKVPFEAPPR